MKRFALLAVLSIGCGDNDRGDPFEVRSGARLQLRSWLYEDGARQYDRERLYDAKLGAECTVQRWSDGLLYCTPEAAPIVYGDQECQQPFGQVPISSGTAPPFFLRMYRLDGELLPSRMYQRALDPVQRSQFWVSVNNGCEGPYESLDALHYPLEPIELARVEATPGLGDGRLRLTMLTSDDGMQLPSTLEDTLAEEPCEISQLADGTHACVPKHVAPSMHFRDAACTKPLVAFSYGQARSNVAALFDQDGCPTYFRIGAEESKYPLYAILNGACVEVELPDRDIVFGVAEELELAPLEERVTYEARLRTAELYDGAMHLPSPTVFDTRFASTCDRAYFPHDVRCVPLQGTAAVARYYVDDTCASFVRIAQGPRGACRPRAKFAVSAIFDTNFTVYEIGQPLPEVYVFEGGQCRAIDFEPGIAPYTIGSLVPVAEFATAQLVE